MSLIQTGTVSETKFGKGREIQLNTRVFAVSNSRKTAPELLSRLLPLQSNPCGKADFLMVATNLLRKREGVDSELAAYIAERVRALSQHFADP